MEIRYLVGKHDDGGIFGLYKEENNQAFYYDENGNWSQTTNYKHAEIIYGYDCWDIDPSEVEKYKRIMDRNWKIRNEKKG